MSRTLLYYEGTFHEIEPTIRDFTPPIINNDKAVYSLDPYPIEIKTKMSARKIKMLMRKFKAKKSRLPRKMKKKFIKLLS